MAADVLRFAGYEVEWLRGARRRFTSALGELFNVILTPHVG